MRVALFDLSPYTIGGDRVWCENVRIGLNALGHEVTYLRANLVKSVPGARKFTGLESLVNHEVVILSDVYADYQRYGLDLYDVIVKLDKLGVKTILGLHGNLTQTRDLERRREAVRCLAVATTPWATDEKMIDCDEIREVTDLSDWITIMEVIPYEPRFVHLWPDFHEEAWERRRGTLMTGRIAAPKGQRALVSLADRLRYPLTIAGKGQFRSAAQLKIDLLASGAVVTKVDTGARGYNVPWEMRTPSGNVVSYTGPYAGPNEVPWERASVHVNLTADTCSYGHLEYSTLEAIDAGLRAVVPHHVDYGNVMVVNWLPTNGYPNWRVAHATLAREGDRIVEEINYVTDLGPTSRDAVLDLLSHYDPVRYVSTLLNSA